MAVPVNKEPASWRVSRDKGQTQKVQKSTGSLTPGEA